MRTPAATAAGRRRASTRTSRSRSTAKTGTARSPNGNRQRTPSRRAPATARKRRVPRGAARSKAIRSGRASWWWGRPKIIGSRSASWRRRAIVAIAAAAVLAIGYFAWFRDSSFVAVSDVKVEGATSTDREQIVSALTRAAKGMTTLDVSTDRLASAVSGFPTVASVSADASFPHGLTIEVKEREPALVATDGDHQIAVAPDGSLLAGVHVKTKLPVLRVDSLPASGRLTGEPLAEALAVGAAPAPLRPLVAGVAVTHDYGVVVTLRGGIALRFGAGQDVVAKWAAAAAILADPGVTSLAYVDVRVPRRPTIGG